MLRLCVHRVCLGFLCAAGAGVSTAEAGQISFSDATAESGISFEHRAVSDVMSMGVGTGAAWLDVDNDGALDLYLTQGDGPNHLYMNRGDGTFDETAASFGADLPDRFGAGVAAADYDNDGWTDLYLANTDGDVLLRNQEGAGFENVTLSAGFPAQETLRGTGAAWGDYDGDGFLDLYVVHHMDVRGFSFDSRDRLYHNRGDGTFEDMSHLIPERDRSGYSFAAMWSDVDQDGDPDLLLISDCPFGPSDRYTPVTLFRNEAGAAPTGTAFRNVSAETGVDFCRHGMGVAAADYDHNGWIDFFFTNIGSQTTLLANNGGLFTDSAAEAGVHTGFDPGDPGAPQGGTFTWGADFLDADLDGHPDLYVAAGALSLGTGSLLPQPDALLRNMGDGTFQPVDPAMVPVLEGMSRTTATGDFDGDGRPDIVVVEVDGSARLLRNTTATPGNWLHVVLEGSASPRDGAGARVQLSLSDGRVQTAEEFRGSSLGATSARGIHFGLGEDISATGLQVTWPSGTTQDVVVPEVNTRLLVMESLASTMDDGHVPEDVPKAALMQVYPNPFRDHIRIRLGDEGSAGALPGSVHFTLTDPAGRTLFRRSVLHAAGQHLVDVPGRLAAGIYFLRIETQTTVTTHPLSHLPD